MKIAFNQQKLIGQLEGWSYRLRNLLLVIVVAGLVGYGAYLIQQAVTVQPDPAYLEAQRHDLSKAKVVFDKNTIQTINDLQTLNPKVDLSNIGKSDPFSP